MALIPIEGVGKFGVIKDLTPESVAEVPFGAWTDVRNVSFKEGAVCKGPGRSLWLTPDVDPYSLFHFPVQGAVPAAYTICADFADVYAYTQLGVASAKITRVSGPYAGSPSYLWNYVGFNGIPVFNNGIDVPQAWAPADLSTPLVDLPAWPAGYTARVLRGFKNYLVALNILKPGSQYFPRMVKWSHTADPGALPTSWDHTNPALDAGEAVLVPGDDELVDCLALGDTNVVYGATSTHAMRYVGGTYIFGFNQISAMSGLLAPGAVCEVPGMGQHFAVTLDDIVLTNGTQIQSLATPRIRKWWRGVLAQFDWIYNLTRVVVRRDAREIWVLFPTGYWREEYALVWNWVENTWTVLELGDAQVMGVCSIDRSYAPSGVGHFVGDLLLGSIEAVGPRRVTKVDATGLAEGSAFYSFLERRWLAPSLDRNGVVQYNPRSMKNLTAIHPRFDAPAGAQFVVLVGSRENLTGPVTWGSPVTYTHPDPKVDVYSTGRLFDVRFREDTLSDWKLYGYDLDITELGRL